MYEQFFELKRRPFLSTPDPQAYFPSRSHEEAMALLRYCATEGEGNAVVLGPPGTGKTLLCQLLLNSLQPSHLAVFVAHLHLTSVEALLQAILYDLSVAAYEGFSENQMRLKLIDFVTDRMGLGQQTAILIDEAQHLGTEPIEELRLLTNLESRGRRMVQVFLFGQAGLESTLAQPALEAFRQRLAMVTRLRAWDQEETIEYIRAHLVSSGGSAESIFTAAAISEIHERSGGIPRRVNQLCHRSLLLAYAHEAGTVDTPYVEAAAAQLMLAGPVTAHHPHSAVAFAPHTDPDEPPSPMMLAPGLIEVGAEPPGLPDSARSSNPSWARTVPAAAHAHEGD